MKKVYTMLIILLLAFSLSYTFNTATVSAAGALSLDEVPDEYVTSIAAYIDNLKAEHPDYKYTSYIVTASYGYNGHLWFSLLVMPEPSYISVSDSGQPTIYYTASDFALRNLEGSRYLCCTLDTNLSTDKSRWTFYDRASGAVFSGGSYFINYPLLDGNSNYESSLTAANFAFRDDQGDVFFYPLPLMGSVLARARLRILEVLEDLQAIAPILIMIGIGTILSLALLVTFSRKYLHSQTKSRKGYHRRFRRRRVP